MPDNLDSRQRGLSRDVQIDHILTKLDELRLEARAEGLDAMADTISRAFDTCLTRYLAEKEAELIARIATR
jgi:hypothetical protein